MILQDDPIPPRIEWFVDIIGGTEGWMLIGCGIMTLIWFLYEGYRKGGLIRPKKEECKYDEVSRALKVMSYLGIFFGMLVLATAAVGMIYDIPPSSKMDPDFGYDRLTSIVLIILGFFMFIKPV